MSSNGLLTNKVYGIYEERLEREVSDGPIPKHIAIIMMVTGGMHANRASIPRTVIVLVRRRSRTFSTGA